MHSEVVIQPLADDGDAGVGGGDCDELLAALKVIVVANVLLWLREMVSNAVTQLLDLDESLRHLQCAASEGI